MKYRLDLLPLRAFQGRGTPVGGRGLRLWGYTDDGTWIATGDEVSDPNAVAAPLASAAESAPAPANDVAASFNDPVYSGAPLTPAPANQWQQTINDIYQQEFGRQADASGMESFTNLLNQGLTGEQMREALRTSAEGQSYGLSPDTGGGNTNTTDEWITGHDSTGMPMFIQNPNYVNPNAGWEWQPPQATDSGTSQAYWQNANTGERRELAAPMNIQTVRDEAGNVSYVNADTGETIDTKKFDKNITGYKTEITNLYKSLLDRTPDKTEVAAYDKQLKDGSVTLDDVIKGFTTSEEYIKKNMPFLDPNADVNTKFEQGVRGFDERGLTRGGHYEGLPTHYYDPTTGKLAAWFGTNSGLTGTDEYTWHTAAEANLPGAEMRLAKESTRDVGKDWRSLGKNAAMIYGSMLAPQLMAYMAPAAGAGLTAIEAAELMGGTLSQAGAASTVGGTLATEGLNWSAVAAQAAKTAAINAAVTAASGGNIGDVLKAGAVGALTGGAGVAGADLMGGGTLAQIGTQTAISTAIAAARGQNPYEAALTGALTATLSNVIPTGTSDVLNGAGITDPSIQKAINSAISSSVISAVRGGDIGTAAIMGAVNSALTSVAGMIGDTQVVKDLKASLTDTISSTVDSIKYEIGATNAQALPVSGSNQPVVSAPLDAENQPDVVNSILQQDAQDAMNRNLPTTPPLISQATGQSDAELMAQALNNFQQNPTAYAPLSTLASATTSDVNPVTLAPNRFSSSGPVSVSWNEPETVSDTTAGGFLGEFGDLAPSQSKLATFGQGVASALDNTVGAILPTVTQMASYLGLRTADQIAELTASLIGKNYQANPELMREISNRVAEAISNPVGKAFGVTNTPGYTGEASGQALRFISENIDKGADYLSQKTGLPAGDIRLMTDAILMRPGTALSTLREAGTAVKDVGRGYEAAATGIIDPNTSGAYNLGATVADLTRAPDTSLLRGESPTRNINLGEIIDEAPSYVSPERLSAPTPALGYSPAEVVAPTRDVASVFNDAFAAADRIPTYDVPALSRTEPSVATQLAPESRSALPTTFAEPAIKPIDLGPNLDSSSLATITEQAKVVDQNLGSRTEPQLQAQKSLIDTTIKTFAENQVDPSVAKFWNGAFAEGAYSNNVIEGIKNTFDNKSAPPEVILKQVDKAVEPLSADEQLPAKLEMLSNASRLGITPAEAIKLGLLNNNGTKTELGEKVSPTIDTGTKTNTGTKTDKKFWDEVIPPLAIKPPIIKPPIINPPPPSINPPPIVNPPIPTPPSVNPPIVNPPIDINPPIVKPPIVNPPPLVQAAITPPKVAAPATTMTPSYMYGSGTQGTTVGALPGNLQSTFLQGVNVNEYNPFENYNVYQQLAPVHAKDGGSPLQLAQLQQGISGVDPSLYGVLQKRATPNYFTYGQDTSGGNPTTFAGSQLLGKPTPGIPVIPTGQKAGSDWLYQGSGTNPLAMAGTGIANLPTGTMAEGGQAHGGEGEHIPEFITGATGHYVRGRGDGQSDDIPAMLADGEYVFDASTVSTLGNGSSDAGAKLLDAFRESLRNHTRSAPADKIPPKASPLEYMKEALQQVGRK